MDDSALRPLEVVTGNTTVQSFGTYVKKYWLIVLLIVLGVNSFLLDLLFFSGGVKLNSKNSTNPVSIPFVSQNSCPDSCISQFNAFVSSKVSVTPSSLSSIPVTPTLTPSPTASPTPTPNTVREFFVPLGIGSSTAGDWETISAVGATIDTSNYGSIKAATFEITIRVPTGNQTVWVRLYDANTYQTVVGSEMSMSGGTPTLLVSSPISLVSGSNLYQVQIKTQLQYPAYIDQARIRIQTN